MNAMTEAPASDPQDVRASLAGDGAAYARLVNRHTPAIAKRMTRFARGQAAIEELVHDVFVEAYLSLRTFHGTAPFEHWLQKIATRVGYRYWQRLKKDNLARVDEHHAAATSETSNEVFDRLQQLPPRDRLVLTLLYVESRSVAETAELAGWSQTMVKVQAYRARAKLRKLLDAS